MDASASEAGDKLTIDELARTAGLPVRTLREYHTMRLLPPPERRGRVGVYGLPHIQRLQLIARLQHRGYSLAGIRDLLQAWDSGTELTALLGVEPNPAALDETPLRLSQAELAERLPGLTEAGLRQAEDVGLVCSDGPGQYMVRSPALLGLVADAVHAGVALSEMLDLIGTLLAGLDELAQLLATLIIERIWEPLASSERASEMPALLQRGRLLILQGITSSLADRLAAALLERAENTQKGEALRAAIDRIRVGVVTDSVGRIHPRSGS